MKVFLKGKAILRKYVVLSVLTLLHPVLIRVGK